MILPFTGFSVILIDLHTTIYISINLLSFSSTWNHYFYIINVLVFCFWIIILKRDIVHQVFIKKNITLNDLVITFYRFTICVRLFNRSLYRWFNFTNHISSIFYGIVKSINFVLYLLPRCIFNFFLMLLHVFRFH